MPKNQHPTTQSHEKLQTKKLKVRRSPRPLKRVGTKPKKWVKRVNWCQPGLYSLAKFLRSVSVEGFPCEVVERIAITKAVYIIGRTLHVHILHLRKRDEINFILLATSLGVVTEVRIHNFEIHYYLTWRREHVCLTQGHWNIVEFVLPYINRGP